MSLERRIRRLEAGSGNFACLECGGGPLADSEPPWVRVHTNPIEPRPAPEGTWCCRCGRPLVAVVTWNDRNEKLVEGATT